MVRLHSTHARSATSKWVSCVITNYRTASGDWVQMWRKTQPQPQIVVKSRTGKVTLVYLVTNKMTVSYFKNVILILYTMQLLRVIYMCIKTMMTCLHLTGHGGIHCGLICVIVTYGEKLVFRS